MFLRKGTLIRICVTSVVFIIFAAGAFLIAHFIKKGGQSPTPTVTVGIVFAVIAVVNILVGIYAEGMVKPLEEARRLVGKELDPDRFIAYYNAECSADNFISKPGYDISELLLTAYELTGNLRGKRAQLALMKKNLGKRYAAHLTVLEATQAYEDGDTETGDKLLEKAEKKAPASVTIGSMADIARKSARAKATGDLLTAKTYYNGVLNGAGLMKADNAGLLTAHWELFRICEDTGESEEALGHLKWCAEYGGSTAIRSKALALLK